jgi:predicted RNA-binding protein YlxR (DUF448 family)
MAVDQSTASPAVRAVIRTCVGCRQRASAAELLRVVVAPGANQRWVVTVDPQRHAPGRGASVHPTPECVALAERRRAYARALRIPGPVDASAVVEYVEAKVARQEDSPRQGQPGPERTSRKREEAAMSPR